MPKLGKHEPTTHPSPLDAIGPAWQDAWSVGAQANRGPVKTFRPRLRHLSSESQAVISGLAQRTGLDERQDAPSS